MRLARSSACALALICSAVAWADDTKKPHELPTYSGEKPAYHAPVKPPKPGQLPDARELFQRALDCWPVPSFMRAEVNLEGRVRSDRSQVFEDDGVVRTGGRVGMALVARLPLYSARELDREREREYMRRTKLADATGSFISILAERQKHVRKLDLLRALERRSQERVKAGITETNEQVAYMEKVAAIEGELLKQAGQMQKARLELIGHCAPSQADEVDRFILQFIPKD